MTSLQLFQEQPPNTDEPPEWGTGEQKGKTNLWLPKAPTWHYSGKPIEQYYTLTQLKRSNVRTNDQLLPAETAVRMGDLMIDKPFPAEHPFASHQPRFAVFPKFDSPEDPRRGVDARNRRPKDAEMPSQPYDVTIVSKTKGSGLRHEIQALPSEADKEPLVWHEKNFDQIVKSPSGGQQEFYPTPPKTFVPNLEKRSDQSCIKGNMQVAPRSANALRNVERDQWQTTYDLAHTGLGPSNPKKLDNFDDKMGTLARTGQLDDNLYARSVPSFDPPRPMEGRIARRNTGIPAPQTQWQPPKSDPTYKRKMTLTEREEHRLWNGQEYINLPEGESEEQWKELNDTAHPDSGLSTLYGMQAEPDGVPYLPAGAPPPEIESFRSQMQRQQHDEVQQMEASNRWHLLESQKPHHDVKAMQHKLDLASVKEQPGVFYDHEGKFQRERAGMYKTTYDPYSLQYSMNKEELSGSKLFDKSDCHTDSLNLPVDLNEDMAAAMRYNRTLGGPPGSVPQYNSQPNQYETIEPFNRQKALQKAALTPNVETADVRTQENGIILTESTQGASYNTKKFLQENEVPFGNRKEPLVLMSHENQDINQVRSASKPRTAKSVQFSDEIMVGSGAGAEPLRLASAHIENPKNEVPYSNRPQTSPVANVGIGLGDGPSHKAPVPQRSSASPAVSLSLTHSTPSPILDLPVELPKNRITSRHLPNGIDDQHASRSTNIQPAGIKGSWAFGTSYGSQYPAFTIDLSYKSDDPRFHYKVGCGMPRPQSSLLKIQDSFTKSDTKKRFLEAFPEMNPDLRENIVRGKKHTFGGMNAQVLRGAPVSA